MASRAIPVLPPEIFLSALSYIDDIADLKSLRLQNRVFAAGGARKLFQTLLICFTPASFDRARNVAQDFQFASYVEKIIWVPMRFVPYLSFDDWVESHHPLVYQNVLDEPIDDQAVRQYHEEYRKLSQEQLDFTLAGHHVGFWNDCLPRLHNLRDFQICLIRRRDAEQTCILRPFIDRASCVPHLDFWTFPDYSVSHEKYPLLSVFRPISKPVTARLSTLELGGINVQMLEDLARALPKSPSWIDNVEKLGVRILPAPANMFNVVLSDKQVMALQRIMMRFKNAVDIYFVSEDKSLCRGFDSIFAPTHTWPRLRTVELDAIENYRGWHESLVSFVQRHQATLRRFDTGNNVTQCTLSLHLYDQWVPAGMFTIPDKNTILSSNMFDFWPYWERGRRYQF